MEARIREELSSDEVIQAVGRAADITDSSLEAQGDVVHLVGNGVEVVPRTHTELRFSRRNTRAASALRSQLEARGFSWKVEDVPLPPAHRRRATIVPGRIS